MDQGAREKNESMFRAGIENNNEAVNKKLDRIIDLLENLIAASSHPEKLETLSSAYFRILNDK